MKKYVVREGDTMWSIAEANGIRPKLLMTSNPQVRNPNQLKPGTVIIIPELTKNTGHGKDTTGSVHPEATVVGGPEYGGQMATGGAMIAQNGDGDVMAHPGPMSSPEMPMTDPTAATTDTDVYGSAHVGSKTDIPAPATTGIPAHAGKSSEMPPFFGFVWPHAVQPGETWDTIQQKYNVQMQHLLQMNPGLANRPLRPGDLLYVPGMVPSAQLPSWASQTTPVHPAHKAVTGGGTETMQPPYTPGQGYDPLQPPYTPGSGSQWSEPYGPHQHNPFRSGGEMYAGETWEQSSDWVPPDDTDENGAWRSTHFADSGEQYHKFAVPENPTNEISVYLGDDDEGPEPEF